VTTIDRENAHAIRIDFNLKPFDLNDPVEVIGKLLYGATADRASPFQNAERAILRGTHPYSAQEQYNLTDRELEAVVKAAHQKDPYLEIDWGSV
jgi:hypothetical protein